MNFPHEINKIMLVDGILFILPGIGMLFKPSTHRILKEKVDNKIAAPALRDVRRLLGAAYLSMGVFMAAAGGTVSNGSELNRIAQLRAVSLIFIVFAGLLQIMGKRWKIQNFQVMYTFLYAVLVLAYLYLGLVEPLPPLP
jgi:hypothetical protein